jgi:hypothetical protein
MDLVVQTLAGLATKRSRAAGLCRALEAACIGDRHNHLYVPSRDDV